eukprot:m.170661 g.170661  ORF g.170661 m.170661 type:complete len:324 (-) comp13271_c0_seq1:83-1054(-)
MSSTAVKRIMREARELRDPTDQYAAGPLEDNLFEWHFTIAGPSDTAFAGGRYHGRILLPTEYPMKPPSIILLTPNGRFEVGKKICLTISAHHPESWQPSWSIRTMLLAIITFLPTEGKGAIAALDYTDKERQDLAAKSVNWQCPYCKVHMRDALADKCANLTDADRAAVEEMRNIGFQLAPRSRNPSDAASKEHEEEEAADGSGHAESGGDVNVDADAATADDGAASKVTTTDSRDAEHSTHTAEHAATGSAPTAAPALVQRRSAQTLERRAAPAAAATTAPGVTTLSPDTVVAPTDWSFRVAIMGVIVAIAFLLYRKFTREV